MVSASITPSPKGLQVVAVKNSSPFSSYRHRELERSEGKLNTSQFRVELYLKLTSDE